MSDFERRRVHDAFRRLPLQSGAASRAVFLRQVLGEGVPQALGERIFAACGGGGAGGAGGSGRGIHVRELIMLLVLITRGTYEEKAKCKKQEKESVYEYGSEGRFFLFQSCSASCPRRATITSTGQSSYDFSENGTKTFRRRKSRHYFKR